MFEEFNPQTIEGLENYNTSMLTSMQMMFENCSNLKELDISHFDTSNVTDMSYMFRGCKFLKALNLSEIEIGENVKTDHMLYNLTSLDSLAISRTMYRLDDNACMNTGTPQHPCTIYAPEGFRFGTATDGPYFRWKSGCFRRPGTFLLGDVNHDGHINVMDVTLIIDHVLGKESDDFHAINADLDEDGYINVMDVTQVIDIILNQ